MFASFSLLFIFALIGINKITTAYKVDQQNKSELKEEEIDDHSP